MWSLRSSTDDPFDTFLVVSFISETRILAMNLEDKLEETEIEGFCSQVQTLFCHDAIHNQLVQVGSHFVFLLWWFSSFHPCWLHAYISLIKFKKNECCINEGICGCRVVSGFALWIYYQILLLGNRLLICYFFFPTGSLYLSFRIVIHLTKYQSQ